MNTKKFSERTLGCSEIGSISDIKDIVYSMPLYMLVHDELCHGCIAAGINLQDALHNPQNMEDGRCLHCQDTYEEFGSQPVSSEQSRLIKEIIEEFEKYKDERLDAE